jgi:hypothetical protein
MRIYCFIATKKNEYLNQTIFSILSLLKHNKTNTDFDKIIIFTDRLKYFEDFFNLSKLPIELIELNPTLTDDWLRPAKNIFRIKLKVFEHIWNSYPQANIIFMDSDTVVTTNMKRWFQLLEDKLTLMNTDEGNISHNRTYGIRVLYKNISSKNILINSQPFIIPTTLHMFNAGVIGIGHKNKQVLLNTISFHDDFFNSTQHYNSEQISLSYVLSTQTQLETCDDDLIHYWYFKEFQKMIDRTIEELKNLNWDDRFKYTLPIDYLPTRKKFKSIPFAIKFKLKRKLYRLGLIDSYVDF